MMNSIRDGPRDRPRVSAKPVCEAAGQELISADAAASYKSKMTLGPLGVS